MKHLYLHVGLHKTGTTSIQNTLFAERAALAAAGIRYFGASPNHSGILIRGFAADPAEYNRTQPDPPQPGKTPDGARQRIAAFIAAAPPSKLVISGEGADRLDESEVRRMLAFLREKVDRLTIIAFVRPPRSFIRSAAQQRVRGGLPLDRLGSTWPRYRKKLEKFLLARDLADMTMPIYHPTALLHGCSVATMLRAIDAPDGLYRQLLVRRENTALSRPAVALMLAANEILPRHAPDGSANPARSRHLFRLLEGWPGPRFEIPDGVLDHVLCEPKARRHIAWIEQKLGRGFASLEPAVPDAPATDAPTPADWANATLRSVPAADIAALAAHLRGLSPVLGTEAATLVADAIAWIENALTREPDAPLPWGEMRTLARLLNFAAHAIRKPKPSVDLDARWMPGAGAIAEPAGRG